MDPRREKLHKILIHLIETACTYEYLTETPGEYIEGIPELTLDGLLSMLIRMHQIAIILLTNGMLRDDSQILQSNLDHFLWVDKFPKDGLQLDDFYPPKIRSSN